MKRRVIVTGGSKGIGKAIAERFAKEEYDIYLLASNKENLANIAMDFFRFEPDYLEITQFHHFII